MNIEKASFEEMEDLLNFASQEGWNPGLSDGSSFYNTDPNGFFIGKLDGEIVGCISAVAYNNDYGFLGFYIVIPKYRRMGYGGQLWQKAIEYLGNRAIGLDGVVAQQDNYTKSGFQIFYNNLRFSGSVKESQVQELIPISEIPFQTLVDYDTPIFGANRANFLKLWLKNTIGFAKTMGKQLTGYGCIRPCKIGNKIGPLFANDYAIAKEIFLALVKNNSEIYLDVPEINSEAMLLAQEFNLKEAFKTVRMYKGTPPKQELKKVFGVTSFELG